MSPSADAIRSVQGRIQTCFRIRIKPLPSEQSSVADALDLEPAFPPTSVSVATGGPAITSPGLSTVRRAASAIASAQANSVGDASSRRPSASRRIDERVGIDLVRRDDHGPEHEPEVRLLHGRELGWILPLEECRESADLAFGTDHGSDPRARRERRAGDRRRSGRRRPSRSRTETPRTRRRSARSAALHRDEKRHVRERILGVLARTAATEEE